MNQIGCQSIPVHENSQGMPWLGFEPLPSNLSLDPDGKGCSLISPNHGTIPAFSVTSKHCNIPAFINYMTMSRYHFITRHYTSLYEQDGKQRYVITLNQRLNLFSVIDYCPVLVLITITVTSKTEGQQINSQYTCIYNQKIWF